MAHFAKLDENNLVTDVFVVNNIELDKDNEEQSGITFLIQWSGGYELWKQTSYNGSFRKNYAGIGYFYDVERNAFIPPNPNCHPENYLDEETCQWICTNEEHELAEIMAEQER